MRSVPLLAGRPGRRRRSAAVGLPVAALIAVAAALLLLGTLIGATAAHRLRPVVHRHRRRVVTVAAAALAAGGALAIAYDMVLGRQGTCARPAGTQVGGTSASLCEVVAPWLLGWAAGLAAIGLVVGGIAAGTCLRGSRGAPPRSTDSVDGE